MGENQLKQQKFLIVVEYVEGPDDILVTMIFAEFVSEKKQMQGNSQELENQVGRKDRKCFLYIKNLKNKYLVI